MTKQEADFIGSMNMCDEISNEAYKKIMCNCEVEESQPITSPSQHMAKQAENFGKIAMAEIIWQAEETEEEFILTTISPFAQNVIQKIIPKEDLKEVLIRGFRKGHWKMIGGIGMAYKCSVCKSVEVKNSKFCPNCGAEMRGDGE